ncbi:MAG: alpha-glucan family phosphorylase [Betaproteobacteria bacterium]|nr:alpha-glucan family phosphorylase [Betaproteobacteria bacterium]
MHPARYLPRYLPKSLQGLAELALDLRFSFSHAADALWEALDPGIWRATEDPWLILETVSESRLEALSSDPRFIKELDAQLAARRKYRENPSWFATAYPKSALGRVAYFSMEFGLGETLPIYSGGLGILAGDYLKTASDLGVPVVGVGLLYQQGYFRQALDGEGNQLEYFPYNDPGMLPVLPLRTESDEWLRVTLDLPGRSLVLRAWEAQVGRCKLYLLDSNDLSNTPGDRSITGELYGGSPEMRLQQEIVLGIGGWRLLEALGLECDICHLNEGHAAFAVIERAKSFADKNGVPFSTAWRVTRAGNLFTTHTPVAAGFDRFAPDLMRQYFRDYCAHCDVALEELLTLARDPHPDGEEGTFNMAYLAVHGSGKVNAVSRLHAEVSRRIFAPLFPRWPEAEVPVGYVTNGVHVPSWHSAHAEELWANACGPETWLGGLESMDEELRKVSDRTLWEFRNRQRAGMIDAVRARFLRQMACHGAEELSPSMPSFDPGRLTIGFARRFATYKRPNLLLHDRDRLWRLLANAERPVQLVVAGKAHPRDEEGKRMVREWLDFMREPHIQGRMVFIEDYDMATASDLVQGVDLWINTPRRLMEASGTSGMKLLVNGGLNLSELDGWWAEAYSPEMGWALGDGTAHGEDPAWDAQEAQQLYAILENEVIPAFYTRDEHGIPTGWVARMRESMMQLTPRFSANRMVREYVQDYYLPSAQAYRARAAEHMALARKLDAGHRQLVAAWPMLRFGELKVDASDSEYRFEVDVYLDQLPPEAVRVEIYAEPMADGAPATVAMAPSRSLDPHTYHYEGRVAAKRPAADYTPRIVPNLSGALMPMEEQLICWAR